VVFVVEVDGPTETRLDISHLTKLSSSSPYEQTKKPLFAGKFDSLSKRLHVVIDHPLIVPPS
jgi:hypothetical protein